MEVIVSHMNLDFDGLACMLAAKKLHPDATVALTDKQQITVKSYLAIYRDRLNFSSYKQISWDKVDTLILVDVAAIKRTGLNDNQLPESLHTIVYDHHSPKEGDVTSGERYIETVGAAITMLTEKIIDRSIPISPFEATLFGLGLYTDTGNFTYPQVTARDLHVAATLREYGMDVSLVSSFSEQILSTDEMSLFQTLLTNGQEKTYDGLTIFLTTHEQSTYQGGLANLTHRLLDATHSDAVITVVKMKNDVFIATRASSKRIDFRNVMETLGGGGHAQAASAIIKKGHVADVNTYFIDHMMEMINPAITATAVMASPVKYVSPDDEIQNVLKQMFQFGHTGFPVVDEDNQLVGVISRRDVDKATHHGLGHAPVKGYMSTNPITLTPHASLEEIQETMMKHNIGRIPIVDNEKLIGILSRTDVIEQLHKQSEVDDHLNPSNTSMKEMMQSILPSATFNLLEQVGLIADQNHLNVYLIGGIVRDFFLNRSNEDIDLVVEGDGIAFATILSEKLEGELVTHDSFGTANWVTPAGISIDVVTCRTEYYEAPGLLPTVRASNIREDLSRRDFTINAMALRINKRHFGEILDYYQGRKDIENKTIRILHTLSFIDDPTRIFRGVRFAIRFNYQFDNQTKKLAKDAAATLKQVSPARLYRELELLIAEDSCMDSIKMLDQLNVWTACFQVTLSTTVWSNLERLIASGNTNPFTLLITLLYSDKKWVPKISPYLQTTLQNKLVAQVDQIGSILFSKMDSHGELHDKLHSISSESIRLYAFLTKKEFLISYIEKREKLTVFLTGIDLINYKMKPGPHFTSILHQLACLQLDDHIQTKSDAIKWLESTNNHLNV